MEKCAQHLGVLFTAIRHRLGEDTFPALVWCIRKMGIGLLRWELFKWTEWVRCEACNIEQGFNLLSSIQIEQYKYTVLSLSLSNIKHYIKILSFFLNILISI